MLNPFVNNKQMIIKYIEFLTHNSIMLVKQPQLFHYQEKLKSAKVCLIYK